MQCGSGHKAKFLITMLVSVLSGFELATSRLEYLCWFLNDTTSERN